MGINTSLSSLRSPAYACHSKSEHGEVITATHVAATATAVAVVAASSAPTATVAPATGSICI
eukprot:743051-Rhodomonas_salina.2